MPPVQRKEIMKKTDVEITVGTVKSSYAEQEAKFQKEWKEREQAANVARKAAEEEEYRQRVLKVEEAKRLLQKKMKLTNLHNQCIALVDVRLILGLEVTDLVLFHLKVVFQLFQRG